MKKLALLSAVLLIATAFAQTAPVKTGTWNVTNDGAFTAQYDTAVWKEVTDPEAEGKDALTKTILVPTDGAAAIALTGVKGTNPDRTFKETTTAYVEQIKQDRGSVLLGIGGETLVGGDKGVFIAYIQEPPDSKHIAFVVNDWIFPGDINDVDSHSGILIEGLFPATGDDTWFDKMHAVVITLKRNAVPKVK